MNYIFCSRLVINLTTWTANRKVYTVRKTQPVKYITDSWFDGQYIKFNTYRTYILSVALATIARKFAYFIS